MPRGLRRFHESGQSHFVTFSCYRRQPYFASAEVFDLFVGCLEDMRLRFDLCVYGYVVMPEHVHLLLSEPAAFARDCSSQVSAQKTGANLGHLPISYRLRDLASGGMGVNRTFFERNIYLVADDGLGLADGSHGKLEHGCGLDANGGHVPGL